jgi:LacI family transcriptional regulator
MSITVKDVAREAGVSRTTVSNVFNGKTKYSDETREAVLDAARRLGYKPNLAAKALITHKSSLIGLVLPSYVDKNTLTTSPFYNIIMDGIYSVLQNEMYDLIIYSVPNRAKLSQVSDWIDSRNVDGILAIGEFDAKFLREIDEKTIPVVLIDNYQKNYTNFSYINSDDEQGGYLATRALIETMHRRNDPCRIGLCAVSPLKTSPLMQKRCEGYRRAIGEAGCEEWIFEGNGGNPFDYGRQIGARLVEKHMDGIFCTEDMLAVGVLHYMLENGVRVGQEFGLAGFDNLSVSRQVYPELTTIDQNIFEKGEVATKTLLTVLKEGAIRCTRLILPVQLVRRGTA